MAPYNSVLNLLDLNPRKYGSLEEYMVRVSDSLRERNCRSIIAFPEDVPPFLREKYEAAGAIIERMASEGPELYKDYRRLLRTYRPEIVHFHFYNQFSVLPVYSAVFQPKATILFTDHSRLPIERPLTHAKCWLWDRFILGPLKVKTLGVSGHVKSILEKNYGMAQSHVSVLFNGVNVSRFAVRTPQKRASLFSEFGIAPQNKLLVAAGYFITEKGFSYLLKAMARAREVRDDVHLILVGDGPVEAELKAEADRLKLQDRVHFAGLRHDVDRFMSASDAVIVPSIWQEPAGLVVVEAMATGRPVIASRVGGIPEYLDEQACGLLVPPRDEAALADSILELLNHPELSESMGKAGRRRAERFFSMEKWVDDTIAIYESFLPGRQPHMKVGSETLAR